MPKEAKLKRTKHGLVPSGRGWFVVNAMKARWWRSKRFGRTCVFEGNERFPHLGVNLSILEPGQPNCMYHRESDQEDFLVLAGRCRLLIDEREVTLKAWDFVHCPPGTNHVFVGAGSGPCAILMMGARRPGTTLTYPASPLAHRYGASVAKRTHSPTVAYRDSPRWLSTRGRWPVPRGSGGRESG
jgi:uncharacterized cupin superfamily protein